MGDKNFESCGVADIRITTHRNSNYPYPYRYNYLIDILEIIKRNLNLWINFMKLMNSYLNEEQAKEKRR
jgi:hypothetical protein